jgi:hypothetical protein
MKVRPAAIGPHRRIDAIRHWSAAITHRDGSESSVRTEIAAAGGAATTLRPSYVDVTSARPSTLRCTRLTPGPVSGTACTCGGVFAASTRTLSHVLPTNRQTNRCRPGPTHSPGLSSRSAPTSPRCICDRVFVWGNSERASSALHDLHFADYGSVRARASSFTAVASASGTAHERNLPMARRTYLSHAGQARACASTRGSVPAPAFGLRFPRRP